MSVQFPLYRSLQIVSKCWGQNIFSNPEKGKCEKFYVFLFIITLAMIYVMIMLWRLKVAANFASSLYSLTYLVLFFCNSSSLYFLNFSQRINLCKLFKNINLLYRDLTKHFPGLKMEEEKQFNTYFIEIHIFWLPYSILQYLTYFKLNYSIFQATPIIIFSYLVVLTILQYTCVIFIIKNVLDSLNKQISEFRTIIPNLHNIRNQTSISSNVKFVLKSYDKVFEIANEVNKIFGVVLLAIYFMLLVSLIRSVAMSMHFGIFKWDGSELFSMTNIVGCLLWLVSL